MEDFYDSKRPAVGFIEDRGSARLLHYHQDMEISHINNEKLYEIVMEKAVLDPQEVEHLKTCDECMQMIRVLVRQKLAKKANP